MSLRSSIEKNKLSSLLIRPLLIGLILKSISEEHLKNQFFQEKSFNERDFSPQKHRDFDIQSLIYLHRTY